MYKKTQVPLGTPSVNRNVRSDLAQIMRRRWVEHPKPDIFGMQYFKLESGHVRWSFSGAAWERRDLFVVQYPGCNVFIEPSGALSIQPWDGYELEPTDREEIKSFCATLIAEGSQYYDYFCHEKAWLEWLMKAGPKMDGLTVQEAIDALEAYKP